MMIGLVVTPKGRRVENVNEGVREVVEEESGGGVETQKDVTIAQVEEEVDECDIIRGKVASGELVWGKWRQVIMGERVTGEGGADGRTW